MSDDVLDLLKTVSQPPMSVDPYAAMATGRKARARRRAGVTVAAAAAVLAVATGSVLVAAKNGTLPARPAPTRPTPTSPNPSTTPRSLTAQFEVPGGRLTANLDPAVTTITVRGAGDSPGSSTLAVPVPSSAGAASCRTSPALVVLACAVRAPVRGGILAYNGPATPDVTVAPPVVGRFSVPDVSVVLVPASATDLPSLRGAVWELDNGTVANSSGAPVAQAHGRAVPVAVFALPQGGSFFMGLRPDSGGGWVASGPTDFGAGVPNTGMGTETGDYYAYMLPAAAVSATIQPPSSATISSQEVLVLGARKVLVAQLTGVKRFSGPSVEWVDKGGGVHPIP
jgi:hypothetical protein